MLRRFRITIPILCALFCFALVLGFASAALAAGEEGSFFSQLNPLGKIGEGANVVIGFIFSFWTLFAGGLLILFTKGLLFVAQFNQFVSSEAVSLGWKIVRDICNMFFVLVLLIIAIGTILQVEKYHYSKLLPQFIVGAIMINFSKTICGVLIDAAQVVMLTFVGAFSGAAGGNLFALLGLHQLWNVISNKAATVSGESEMALLGTFLLVAVFVTIADVVVFVMLMVLIARIVMLWFLIVLSPFAFILSILPGAAQKYAGQWWSEFTNYVIVGPAMAFFLWLSLAVVAQNKNGDQADITHYNPGAAQLKDEEAKLFSNKNQEIADVGITAIGSLSGMLNYVLGIGMLMGTLMVAQQLGVAGGKMAGAAVGGINDVLSGKKGLMPWRSMMGTAWSTFEGKQMDTWKKRGERLGNVGARLADSTIGKLAPTKAGRAEAQTRIEAHKEETTKRKMDHFAKDGDFAKLTPQELRNQLGKEKNGMRRAALISEINKRGNLGKGPDGDKDIIKEQAKFLLGNGGAQMQVEFDDQIKKNDVNAAFNAGRFNDEHGNLSIDKFNAELLAGKFSSEQISDATIEKLSIANNAAGDAGVEQKRRQLEKQSTSKDPAKRVEARQQLANLKAYQKAQQDAKDKHKLALEAAQQYKNEINAKKAQIQAIKDAAKAEGRDKLKEDEKKNVKRLEGEADVLKEEALAKKRTAASEQENEREAQSAAYKMAGHQLYGNRLVGDMKDAKQIGTVISGLNTTTWRALRNQTSNLEGVTKEQQIAYARAKGAYDLAFHLGTEVDQGKIGVLQTKADKGEALTAEEQTQLDAHAQQELFRTDILSKGDKRDELYKIIDKQAAAQKNMYRIISENNDWKAGHAQRESLWRNAEVKDGAQGALGELVDEYNKTGEERGDVDTIQEQRQRDLLHGISRKNTYLSADGREKDIYDTRGEARADELLRTEYGLNDAAIGAMSWEDQKTKLSPKHLAGVEESAENARKSYTIQVSHDRMQGDELEEQNWRNVTDENLETFLDSYSSEQQRKIVANNKELERKVLEFRHRKGPKGYFEKKVKHFQQRHAAAVGDTEKQKVMEEYEDFKKGTLSTSNRMRKGDNTYTGLSTLTEDETKSRLEELEVSTGLKPVASTPAAPAPATPEPVARPGVRRSRAQQQQQGSRPQPQQPQQPQQPPQPTASETPDDDATMI